MHKIDMNKPVWVYRNLKHGRSARPLYSLVQNGRVVGYRHRLILKDVTFKVRESGRQRVLLEDRKNVHAFAIGILTGRKGAMGIDENGKDLPVKIHYNPHNDSTFMAVVMNKWVRELAKPIFGARVVLLNENGMSAAYWDDQTKGGRQ
jgi:hypothetical protein